MSERMINDYLWDRTGEPDDELRALEAVLERYRFDVASPAPCGIFGQPDKNFPEAFSNVDQKSS